MRTLRIRPLHLLLTLAVVLAAPAAASAATLSLNPPYDVAGATGTASGTLQTLTYSGTVVRCTPNFGFSVTRPVAIGDVGTLIDVVHVNSLQFTCLSGATVVSLNSALDPVVLGQAVSYTYGNPGAGLFLALNVKVRVTAPIRCLFVGTIRVSMDTTGLLTLLGGTLAANPVAGDSPSCIRGLNATVGTSTYTVTPAITGSITP